MEVSRTVVGKQERIEGRTARGWSWEKGEIGVWEKLGREKVFFISRKSAGESWEVSKNTGNKKGRLAEGPE